MTSQATCVPLADGGDPVDKEDYNVDDAAHHVWHTCSECGYDWNVPSQGNHCPICGRKPECASGGECVDDEEYARGGPSV